MELVSITNKKSPTKFFAISAYQYHSLQKYTIPGIENKRITPRATILFNTALDFLKYECSNYQEL